MCFRKPVIKLVTLYCVFQLKTVRTKMEAFDLKNADLLQRSGFGSTEFTRHRWVKQTEQIQSLEVKHKLLARSKSFFQWLQRNFVMMALVDGALGMLIAAGRITSADVFVFARAIEDAIDLLLMRSRAESELATMMSNIEKLGTLADQWEESRRRNLVHCSIISNHTESILKIENLAYTRGTASVRMERLSTSNERLQNVSFSLISCLLVTRCESPN